MSQMGFAIFTEGYYYSFAIFIIIPFLLLISGPYPQNLDRWSFLSSPCYSSKKKKKEKKKRKTTKDNLPLLWQFIFNSLITFRHTHGNLVLKCWQRSVLTKTSTGSFLWSPVFVAWLRWHLFGSISGYHGNHLLLLSKIDGPHTFEIRAAQKLLIEDA